MIRKLLLTLALLAASRLAQAAAPDLQALLTHETRRLRSDGVTEVFRYQERLYRHGDTVWLERVLPRGDAAANEPATAGEHGPNLQILPRWISRNPDGSAALALVSKTERYVVRVKAIEFGRLGFSGSWAMESSLIDPASLQALPASGRRAAQPGARWHKGTSRGRYSHILWSERLQFPLAIETGSVDGRSTSRTSVAIESLAKPLPWTGLEGYVEHEIDDFGD